MASPRAAITGTSSSHIHEVPHSETHKLPRYRKATNATGRVSKPMTRRTPRKISVTACEGAAIAAWLAASPITDFHTAGAWLDLMRELMNPAYPAGRYKPFPRFSKNTHTSIAPTVIRTIASPLPARDGWAAMLASVLTEVAIVVMTTSLTAPSS